MRIDESPAYAPPTEAVLARRRILVVEDEFIIRVLLVEILVDEGYDVVEAATADAAIALLDGSVDLLVTDVQLPGTLDGLALANLARQTHPELPVVFTSGQTDLDAPTTTRDVAIAKPYQGAEICAAVRQLLAA